MFDKKEYMKIYRIENKEKKKEYNKKYYKGNEEYNRKYYQEHKERHKEYHKEYYKEYYQKRKEHYSEYHRKYIINHPEIRKEIRRRSKAKRRSLGFILLNKYFKNSVAHHIDKNRVIYIPEKIHQSIWHCLETNKGMIKINKIAMNFI